MKVSLNWISQYIGAELPPVSELIDIIGRQLGAVETVTDVGAKYRGVIVVKVTSCVPHQDSDHLNVCLIDDGGKLPDIERDKDGLVQVVCGASNVRAGITVAWLPPGSTVPVSYDTVPFVLSARELRGVLSNGMLASPKELSIGDSHDGILILEDDAQAGADFAETYGLNDTIIEIENKMFTHRPDCFGMLGVAREIAGILGVTFHSPDVFLDKAQPATAEDSGRLLIRNELPTLTPRYSAQILDNITIGSSPIWLQTHLSRVGIRPINNIVDLTNYFMMLTGQPMHAYDYDKVTARDGNAEQASIIIRSPTPSEELTLLNGKTIVIRDDAIVIATESGAIGLGGVMGGQDTEVDDGTTSIILESANFNMYSIRKTSMHHGLFSEAVTRFNKGQSPLQTLRVLKWACQEIQAITGATAAQTIYDVNYLPDNVLAQDSIHSTVTLPIELLTSRLGIEIEREAVAAMLRCVEFDASANDAFLQVKAPFWRTDIEIREDVIEEVGRLYGYDKLRLELPSRTIAPAAYNETLALKAKIRTYLAKAGANEVLTYSFVHGNLLDKVGQDRQLAFSLSNALSPDLQYYRMSLMPSLLDKVHANIKAGYDEFALFEIGKSHILLHKDDDEDGLPQEFDMLGFVYAFSDKLKKTGASFYEAKRFLNGLASELGIRLEFAVFKDNPDVPIMKPYDIERSAYITDTVTGTFIGVVGEFTASTRKNLKLPQRSAGFEISISELVRLASTSREYIAKSRFPEISHDVCYKVPTTTSYGELNDFFSAQVKRNRPEQTNIAIGLVDIYQRSDDADHKQITFRLRITSRVRTMTDDEVSRLLSVVTADVVETFGAEKI